MKTKIACFFFCLLFVFSCNDKTRNILIINQIDRLFQEGKYEQAKTSIDSFINLNSKNELAWTLKGQIEEKLDNNQSAAEAYNKALEINPKAAKALTGMGIISRKNGDYDQSAGYYYKAIKANPNYAPAYSSLVTIELKRKNFENAVKFGEKGYLLEKEDPVIIANLSIAYHFFGDTVNRDRYYEMAKKLKYRNINALPLIFNEDVNIFDN